MLLFRPIARLLVSRGIGFTDAASWLKDAFVDAAIRESARDGARVTESRLSLMTGLQRKDIKAIRIRLSGAATAPPAAGFLPRIMAHWQTGQGFQGKTGKALALPRNGSVGPTFERLVAQVSRDVHPRTVLDELDRLGLVKIKVNIVTLSADAFIPTADEHAMLGYLGANAGDHLAAATSNICGDGTTAPFLERAVHYNHLTEDSVAQLDALSRDQLGQALVEINQQAAQLQHKDQGDELATHRFRAGAFVYHVHRDDDGEPDKKGAV